jgi:hypothetical protein
MMRPSGAIEMISCHSRTIPSTVVAEGIVAVLWRLIIVVLVVVPDGSLAARTKIVGIVNPVFFLCTHIRA